MSMKKTDGIVIVASVITFLGLLATPLIAAVATGPTEVIKEHNSFFLKVHGKPLNQAGQPGFGEVEFTYKNLCDDPQYVVVRVLVDFNPDDVGNEYVIPLPQASVDRWVPPGGSISDWSYEGLGVTIWFELYISADDVLAPEELILTGDPFYADIPEYSDRYSPEYMIWIPPPIF